jgi:hypothetical protein
MPLPPSSNREIAKIVDGDAPQLSVSGDRHYRFFDSYPAISTLIHRAAYKLQECGADGTDNMHKLHVA